MRGHSGIRRQRTHRRRLAGIGAAAVFAAAAASPAHAARVAVLVRSDVPLERGAVGLVVPGAGATVTRAGALAALLRGRVVNSDIGSAPTGAPVISLARRPAEITIYLALPPPGSHHNTRRYAIAIVGGGYHGLLVSTSTRIPGLLSIADVAPTARELARGGRPPVRSRADANAVTDLHRLDARLTSVHDERDWVTIALVALLAVFLLPALLLRSTRAARAALLLPPAAIAVALLFSALDVNGPLATLPLAAIASGLAVAGASRRLFAPLVVLFLAAFLAVLAAWPEVNALAALGPHPDGGVRFYGVTNEVETLLLAPVLAVAAGGRRGAAFAAGTLALVAVGWSRAGADGGGLIVYGLALLLVLAPRAPLGRRSWLRAAGLVAASAAIALIAVAVDAATGGSSHVTHAVGSGPGTLGSDLADRARISWATATSSAHALALVALSLAALAWLALRRPAGPAVTAYLGATALSLLVNDTPVDVAGFGALWCLALWALARSCAGEPVDDRLSRRLRSALERARLRWRTPAPHRP